MYFFFCPFLHFVCPIGMRMRLHNTDSVVLLSFLFLHSLLLSQLFKYSLGLGCMRYYSIILEDLAFKHSLRIYCIDRPGVGMSHTTEPEVATPFFF